MLLIVTKEDFNSYNSTSFEDNMNEQQIYEVQKAWAARADKDL